VNSVRDRTFTILLQKAYYWSGTTKVCNDRQSYQKSSYLYAGPGL